ncbi:DDB1- and CUL4-associated factor 11, partial [Tremellales sp. Uapishka_1]
MEGSADLEDFYADRDDDWEDDEDDGEYFYDLEDGDIEIDEDYEEDDDDDDDDDDGEDGDDFGPGYTLFAGADEDEDDEDEAVQPETESGTNWLEIAALLNSSSAGTTPAARQAILARLLAGPMSAAGTRRNLGYADPEERARVAAAQRKQEKWWEPQVEPHPRGVELLKSGEFGRVGPWQGKGRRRPRWTDPRRRRALGVVPAKATIPNTHGTIVATYPSIPYVGQYAGPDYGVFYTATQYFTLHLYSTSLSKRYTKKRPAPTAATPLSAPTPLQPQEGDDTDDDDEAAFQSGRRRMHSEETSLKKIKTVQGVEGRWTVTDADCDRAGEKMIYSSITPYVHMLYTNEHDSEHVELDFSGDNRRNSWGYDHFGIWSIRFSADGKEVVAGAGSGKIMVYDIESQRRSLSVSGHADDVNAVCFADESSTNILVSGSDDGYVKVWDRRSLSSSTPSGVLVGATEGITYTAPKGDGRYIVVNSKDQAARLYDLRKMESWGKFADSNQDDAVQRYGHPRFDYVTSHRGSPLGRVISIPEGRFWIEIRKCGETEQDVSADGMIHIWSLDGRVVQVLNRTISQPLRASNGDYTDPAAPETAARRVNMSDQIYGGGLNYTVRDVAWHGYEPTLMSTCWESEGGTRRGGTLAKHEWKGLGKGGLRRLEDWVEKEKGESGGMGEL